VPEPSGRRAFASPTTEKQATSLEGDRLCAQRGHATLFAEVSFAVRDGSALVVARLRLSRRPLWILDEPLTALDGEGIDVLRGLLDTHLEGGGVCVAASHQPLPIAPERQQSLRLEADASAFAGSAMQ